MALHFRIGSPPPLFMVNPLRLLPIVDLSCLSLVADQLHLPLMADQLHLPLVADQLRISLVADPGPPPLAVAPLSLCQVLHSRSLLLMYHKCLSGLLRSFNKHVFPSLKHILCTTWRT